MTLTLSSGKIQEKSSYLRLGLKTKDLLILTCAQKIAQHSCHHISCFCNAIRTWVYLIPWTELTYNTTKWSPLIDYRLRGLVSGRTTFLATSQRYGGIYGIFLLLLSQNNKPHHHFLELQNRKKEIPMQFFSLFWPGPLLPYNGR